MSPIAQRALIVAIGAVCLAYFAFWGCAAPATSMRPNIPMPDRAQGGIMIAPSYTHGLAPKGTNTGGYLSPNIDQTGPDLVGAVHIQPNEYVGFGWSLHGGSTSMGGTGTYVRGIKPIGDDIRLGAQFGFGFTYIDVAFPLAARIRDGLWLHSSPSMLGAATKTVFRLPVGLAVDLEPVRVHGEFGMHFAANGPAGNGMQAMYGTVGVELLL